MKEWNGLDNDLILEDAEDMSQEQMEHALMGIKMQKAALEDALKTFIDKHESDIDTRVRASFDNAYELPSWCSISPYELCEKEDPQFLLDYREELLAELSDEFWILDDGDSMIHKDVIEKFIDKTADGNEYHAKYLREYFAEHYCEAYEEWYNN